MNLIKSVIIVILMHWVSFLHAQNFDLNQILKQDSRFYEKYIENAERFKIQIRYTQIDRNVNGEAIFEQYDLFVDQKDYFYPASTIKLFAAALSLEKLNDLKIEGLNSRSRLEIDSTFSGQSKVREDASAPYGYPTLEHYIKELLILSDNDAFNRLYEFLGQDHLNQRLSELGFQDTHLIHRLSLALNEEQNRHTNRFRFYDDSDKLVYEQAAVRANGNHQSTSAIQIGKAYIKDQERIDAPMDFSTKNKTSINDLQELIKRLIFPDNFPEKLQFRLKPKDYELLIKYMGLLPRESGLIDAKGKTDNYCKFFMYGASDGLSIPSQPRILNKIGLAYGFCIDNAYIVDVNNGIEFLLTATIYANENETLNDGNYEYSEVSFPFMEELGNLIYNFELKKRSGKNLDPAILPYQFDH